MCERTTGQQWESASRAENEQRIPSNDREELNAHSVSVSFSCSQPSQFSHVMHEMELHSLREIHEGWERQRVTISVCAIESDGRHQL